MPSFRTLTWDGYQIKVLPNDLKRRCIHWCSRGWLELLHYLTDTETSLDLEVKELNWHEPETVVNYTWILYRVDGMTVSEVSTSICTSPKGSGAFKTFDIRHKPRKKEAIYLGWILTEGKYKLELIFTDNTGANIHRDMTVLDIVDRGRLYIKGWSLIIQAIGGLVVLGVGVLMGHFL